MKPGVKAMNYISYTATPYSNFLNESLPESLYPTSFIRSLTPSEEYFGPQQIFGVEGTERDEGLDIIRWVDDNDLDLIKNLSARPNSQMPESLIDSIAWFLCCAATFRVWDYKKPVSMLIHTSQRQADHDALANLISGWFSQTSSQEILERCRLIWNQETTRFDKEAFRSAFPEYGRDDHQIRDYPDFKSLEPEIANLLRQITHIPLDEEKDLTYTEHIHLCIDNCSKNGISEDGMHVRLAFPDPSMKNAPDFSTAFIIIGGSTLSRGLTIEGLVSTFFLRSTYQADTLMQMGRWFGYRRGYELLPRIWMTPDTYDKFRFLTLLEEELRDDLKRFSSAGASPTNFGPRVKNTPKLSWLRVTAKNKMQNALETDMDFSGTSSQLILFENNAEVQKSNIEVTESFLKRLPAPEPSILQNSNSYIWRNVDFSLIKSQLLVPMKFHPRATLFNQHQLPLFLEWVDKLTNEGVIKNWNVIVAGAGKIDNITDHAWDFGNGVVGMINRSQKIHGLSDDVINLGVLRAPNDLIADLTEDCISDEDKQSIRSTVSVSKVDELREKCGLSNVPQLLIYRVYRNSKARDGKGKNALRKDLEAKEDLIGLNIYIPGTRNSQNLARTLTIKLNGPNEYEIPEE